MKIKTVSDLKKAIRQGPYAWPGGYPLYFITNDGAALSFDTVKKNFRRIMESIKENASDGWRVSAMDVNWEDPELYDDHTSKRIESAYAEDDAESNPKKRKTRRNDGEAIPKKNYWKLIAGAGVIALGVMYLMRRRASAAGTLPNSFPTPPALNTAVAPRIGQQYAQAAQMLNQYRVPFRIVRQDGRALAVTKDRNPNRWNLTVNRGIVVAATKG